MCDALCVPCAGTLLAVEFLLFNFVELKRLADFQKPGSQAEPGSFLGFEGAFKGTGGENGYPGGIFDPLNFSKCALLASYGLEGQLVITQLAFLCAWQRGPCRRDWPDLAGVA